MLRYGYSVKEIIKFTIPMILNSLVMSLMFTVDRLILAKYSITSMNAVAIAGSFLAVANLAGMGITQMASVFVGQYNGMKEYHKIGRPIWQMIYFGLALIVVFLPLAFWCDKFHIFAPKYEAEGLRYLKTLMTVGWLSAVNAALVSFFVGRGKSFIVIAVFLIGNLINVVLDIAFVFGVNGIISPMGSIGAAYATVIGEVFFTLCFGAVFLSNRYKTRYGTLDMKFRPKLFKDCLKIGAPISLSRFASQTGWLIIAICYNHVSPELATCESFAITLWMCFIFCAIGGSHSIEALGANLIGKDQKQSIHNLLKLFLKWYCILCAIFSIPLVFYQTPLLNFAIDVSNNLDINFLNDQLSFLMRIMLIVVLTDGIYYIICGVLSAGGDTLFPTVLEIIALWFGAVIPTIILFFMNELTSIKTIYWLVVAEQTIIIFIAYYRYKSDKWFKKIV